jgi:hypothetical protein
VHDVVFLKRRFAKLGLVNVFRLDVDNVREMASWIRETKETRGWSQQRRIIEILQSVAFEYSLYGKKIFSQEMAQYSEILSTYRVPLPNYDHYFNQYLGLDRGEWWSALNNNDALVFAQAGNDEYPSDDWKPEATRLGDVPPSIDVDNLVISEDLVVNNDPEVLIPEYVPVMDAPFEWPRTYCEQVERELVIHTQALKDWAKNAIPYLRIVPLWKILASDYVWEKLRWAGYMRFSLQIKIRVVATKFHYGALMAVFRPAFHGTQKCDSIEADNRTAYDSIWSGSQCYHKIISITGNQTENVIIDWHYPYQYIPTDLVMEAPWKATVPDFVTLDLYSLTEIMPMTVDMDPPEIIVLAKLRNLRLFGYTQVPKSKPVYEARMSQGGLWAHRRVESINVMTPTLVKLGSLDPIKVLWAQADETESEQMKGPWSTTLMPFVSTAAVVVGYASRFVSWLASTGLSHPLSMNGPKVIAENFLPTAATVGLSPTVYMGMNPTDRCEPLNVANMTIEQLADIPTYYGTTILKNKGDKIIAFLSPTSMMQFKMIDFEANVASVAGYLMQHHRYYRCGVRVGLKFFCSSFLSCKVRVTLENGVSGTKYEAVDDEVFLAPSFILDLNGDVEKEILIPFSHFAPFRDKFFNGNRGWILRIVALTDVVSNEKIESHPISLCIFHSYPGLQFHTPVLNVKEGSSFQPRLWGAFGYARAPDGGTSGPTMAQGILFPKSEFKTSDAFKYGPGDIPLSIYHIIKRPSLAFPLNPHETYAVDPVSSFANKSHPTVKSDLLQWYMAMFKYYRGSVDLYSVDDKDQTFSMVDLADLSPEGLHSAVTPCPTTMDTRFGAWVTENCRSVSVPYRSPFPYSMVPNPYAILRMLSTTTELLFCNPREYAAHTPTICVKGVSSLARAAGDDYQLFCFVGTPAFVHADGQ